MRLYLSMVEQTHHDFCLHHDFCPQQPSFRAIAYTRASSCFPYRLPTDRPPTDKDRVDAYDYNVRLCGRLVVTVSSIQRSVRHGTPIDSKDLRILCKLYKIHCNPNHGVSFPKYFELLRKQWGERMFSLLTSDDFDSDVSISA